MRKNLKSEDEDEDVIPHLHRQTKAPNRDPMIYRGGSGRFVTGADLVKSGPRKVTIESIEPEAIEDRNQGHEGEMLTILHFRETNDKVVLRDTNFIGDALAEHYGDNMRDWEGKVIELYAKPTPRGPGVRARISDEEDEEEDEYEDEDEDEEEDDPTIIAARTIAGAYGISQQEIRDLVKEGKLRRVPLQERGGQYSKTFYVNKSKTSKLLKNMGYTIRSGSKI